MNIPSFDVLDDYAARKLITRVERGPTVAAIKTFSVFYERFSRLKRQSGWLGTYIPL
jgi:hypothetical protein